jgi:hypothetical protein
MLRLVALDFAFVEPAAGLIAFCGTRGKLALEISNDLRGIGRHAFKRRAHARTSWDRPPNRIIP